jgi:hypothetical protein
MGFDRVVPYALLLIPLPGCALMAGDDLGSDDGAEAVGELTAPFISYNGVSLNGVGLHGVSPEGVPLDGIALAGTSIGGMTLDGMSIDDVRIEGSELTGIVGGEVLGGDDLVGARMSGILSDGHTLPMRIEWAELLPGPSDDIWAYGVSYAQADGGWSALCGTGAAIALTGTWNLAVGEAGGGAWTPSSSAFTFGCRGAALAKCVELGYSPWATVSSTPLRDHHQACTRMMRADYCGDGTAWTKSGTLINLYDNLGIQTDSTSWRIDAEWLPDGALCIDKRRDFQRGVPTCWHAKKKASCGSFDRGALLIDEYKH